MYLQRVDNVYDLDYAPGIKYREVFHQDEVEYSKFHFEQLDAPIRRLAAPDAPVPFAPTLEKAYIPQVEDVAAAVRDLAAY
jgi:pyruvate/2-oxoglutarate/acetoin dehydrogenase E1 component